MNSIADLLRQLKARLPELEWKMGHLKTKSFKKQLPPGLFVTQEGMDACIDEIKKDMEALSKSPEGRVAHYLSLRVSEKINVLVKVCQLFKPTQSRVSPLEVLSTREQWYQQRDLEKHKLCVQRDALLARLECVDKSGVEIILGIKRDLGDIERKLSDYK